MLVACAVLLGVIVALPAFAQQPTRVNPTADSVKEQQLLEALKPGNVDAVQGRISIPDRRAGALIQPAGQDWRVWRQTTLPRIGAATILGMIILVLVFFAVKGRIRVEGGLAGREVVRFGSFERFGHWLTATAFIVLAVTGLNVTYGRQLLLPIVGADAFHGISQMAKYLHNYMSFAFVLGLIIMFVQWVVYNLPMPNDIRWIAQGGGIFGKAHPPAGKFNAGQKLLFWVTIIGGLFLSATGYALMFPYYSAPAGLEGYTATTAGLQSVSMWHGLIAVIMIAVIVGHIYIGTLGMQGAFWSMGNGKVDVNWAKQHHSIWAARVVPKDVQGKPTPAE
jgi:formate dehydrogenase subunit gamma